MISPVLSGSVSWGGGEPYMLLGPGLFITVLRQQGWLTILRPLLGLWHSLSFRVIWLPRPEQIPVQEKEALC